MPLIGKRSVQMDAGQMRHLQHLVESRAMGQGRVHREYPLSLRLEGGKWIEGVDLAFIENDTWVVVDFKTDADSPARRAQYERQLQWYAYAISKLTNQSASAVLLTV